MHKKRRIATGLQATWGDLQEIKKLSPLIRNITSLTGAFAVVNQNLLLAHSAAVWV